MILLIQLLISLHLGWCNIFLSGFNHITLHFELCNCESPYTTNILYISSQSFITDWKFSSHFSLFHDIKLPAPKIQDFSPRISLSWVQSIHLGCVLPYPFTTQFCCCPNSFSKAWQNLSWFRLISSPLSADYYSYSVPFWLYLYVSCLIAWTH